ncbi:hypothetical protein [Micromonospora sp. LOL_021]
MTTRIEAFRDEVATRIPAHTRTDRTYQVPASVWLVGGAGRARSLD